MKAQFKLFDTPDGTRVMLGGAINEEIKAIVAANEAKLGPKVTFDFGAVTFINSCGIRDWALFIKRISSRTEIIYDNCTEDVIMQINMVPEFKGKAQIQSLHRDYECPECRTKETVHLVNGRDFSAGNPPAPRDVPCHACGRVTEALEDDESLFSFLMDFD